MKKIICFGEVLWDFLPEGKCPGGAPMNVAIHLKYQGFSPTLISKVGNDELGAELLQFLKKQALSTEAIQVNSTYRTGMVHANVSDKNEVIYEIIAPVAWDFIELDSFVKHALSDCDVIVYGSLAARSEVSEATLMALLEKVPLKVFDVNFRSPYYSSEKIDKLLKKADIVKLNERELLEVVNWYGSYQGIEKAMRRLNELFNFKTVIVTRGGNGAAVLTDDQFFEHPGFKVEVQDTIGSGDAFLAAYLSNFFKDVPVEKCLDSACRAGALIATKKGAVLL